MWGADDIKAGLLVYDPRPQYRGRSIVGKIKAGFVMVSLEDGLTSEPTTAAHMARVFNQCTLERIS